MTEDEAAGLSSLGGDLVPTLAGQIRAGLDPAVFEGAAPIRAANFYAAHIARPDDPDAHARGIGFSFAWTLAERDLLTRLAAVLSSPQAKGRELDIVNALRGGARFDDALRGARRAQAPGHGAQEAERTGGNVVPIRPR